MHHRALALHLGQRTGSRTLISASVWHLLRADELATLRVADVVFVWRPTAALKVPRSKTDQAGHGTVVARACVCSEERLPHCPAQLQSTADQEPHHTTLPAGVRFIWCQWSAVFGTVALRPHMEVGGLVSSATILSGRAEHIRSDISQINSGVLGLFLMNSSETGLTALLNAHPPRCFRPTRHPDLGSTSLETALS